MVIKVSLIANCDDVFLAWNPGEDIPGCIGFKIERRLNGKETILENGVGFKHGPAPRHASSSDYPFQRLAWTDYVVDDGDKVAYRITARIGTQDNLHDGPASDWTDEITLTPRYGDVDAYFNRGVVLSQFMGRIMQEKGWSPTDLKTHIMEVNDRTRNFLAGDLRLALLDLLDEAIHDKGITLHAAMFELTDEEVMDKLAQLGSRLNIVLSNGAVQKHGEDENSAVRQSLKAAGANVKDRMSAPSFLGHNKFAVLSNNGKPARVWTGSVNWQPTGLCTQANNGILVDSESLAQCYLDAWNRIARAGDKKDDDLRLGNMINPPQVHSLKNNSHAFAQFTSVPQSKPEPIDTFWLLDLIAGAKQSLLFAMFMPGEEIYDAVINRGKEIYVRGVANTIPKAAVGKPNVDVSLVDNGQEAPKFQLEVVEPEGIAKPFSAWVEEVTRREFNAIGHAIIHSKVLVIDAFGPNPTIVTGSHNFSRNASRNNDENFVVISGNRPLAQAFATNILGLYDHYRWRKHVAEAERSGKPHWSYLTVDPNWLQQYRASPDRRALLQMLGI